MNITRINKFGYVERRVTSNKGHPKSDSPYNWRNWWFVKEADAVYVCLGNVHLPKEYLGKKVRFKLELMNDTVKTKDL